MLDKCARRLFSLVPWVCISNGSTTLSLLCFVFYVFIRILRSCCCEDWSRDLKLLTRACMAIRFSMGAVGGGGLGLGACVVGCDFVRRSTD